MFICVCGTGIVRASSVFPILSTILLLLGGLCVGLGRIYSKWNNILLSAGILFVAAGKLANDHLLTCTQGSFNSLIKHHYQIQFVN